jgi:large subunit ribosomal protein L3
MATKGLLAKKIGMMQVFTESGELLPVTVLEAGPCTVIALRAVVKDGYGAVQLGWGEVKERKLSKAAAGHFKKAGVAAHRHVREVRLTSDAANYQVGQSLKADLFSAGEWVDVTGTSKGKGFSGQHKRHHFGRGPVTHGSHNIKQPGSIGSSSTPSRVYKGMRMAGQLGNAQRTTMHLKVVRVDLDRNLILVNGDVPGHRNSVVLVRDSTRQPKGKK